MTTQTNADEQKKEGQTDVVDIIYYIIITTLYGC